MKRGTLYGIGVGPGEPELLTIKALNIIKESDVVILPTEPKEECYAYRSVHALFPEIEEKELLCMSFPMIKDGEKLEEFYRKAYLKIEKLLNEGKNIAFLTIGDVSIYSTYGAMHRREIQSGNHPVMVSGVPSFCAAAAAAGISLADKKEEIHVIPASYEVGDTLDFPGTKIYMKSGRRLKALKELLLKSENAKRYEVYAISDCGLPRERVEKGAESIDEKSGYLTVVIVKERGESER